jgi:hypothetical protein
MTRYARAFFQKIQLSQKNSCKTLIAEELVLVKKAKMARSARQHTASPGKGRWHAIA